MKRTNNKLSLTDWLKKQQNAHDGLPCELLEIKSFKEDLEKCVGYRNKCEFTIGKIIYILLKYYLSKNKIIIEYLGIILKQKLINVIICNVLYSDEC